MTVDHWENTLNAMSKAMKELVIPALDPSDQLVYEQAALVSKLLDHLATRLPYYDVRNRVELIDAVRQAQAVEDATHRLDESLGQALTEALERARDVLETPGTPVTELKEASARLTGTVSVAVRRAGEADVDLALALEIERAVVSTSLPPIESHRAWFVDQGWEPDPSQVLELAQALTR